MKKITFLTAMCCSFLTMGTLRAELPTPVFNAALDEDSTATTLTWKNADNVSANFVAGPAATGLPSVTIDAAHGNVRTFDGGGKKIKTAANIAITGGSTARTFAFWAKMNSTIGAPHQVFSMAGGDPNRFFVHASSDGTTIEINNAYGMNGGEYIKFTNSEKSFKDVWSHIALVIADGAKGEDMKCYVNGELWSVGVPKTANYALNTPASFIMLGHAYIGDLSKFKAYNEDLSADQVKELYDAEKPIPNSIEENKAADCIAVQGKSIIVNGTADIQIYDATGRMTMQKNNVSGQMSVDNLQGIYMIRANIDGQAATKKVVF